MANTLTATMSIAGTGQLTKTTLIDVVNQIWAIGSNNFDPTVVQFANGTGAGQANEMFIGERTVGAGLNDDLDLSGTALQNPHNENVAFTSVRALVLDIDAADGVLQLRIGPQGVANAFQGWQGGVGASNYNQVFKSLFVIHPFAGWTVTAGTADILRINNPSASSVTYRILILGTK